jgi:hypothetical protein
LIIHKGIPDLFPLTFEDVMQRAQHVNATAQHKYDTLSAKPFSYYSFVVAIGCND